MTKNKCFVLLFLILSTHIKAQTRAVSSTGVYQSIKQLNFLGTAIYLAAHPDDENTSVISYLSNEVNAQIAYLSLTRGDGGQNLIGSETGELLGVLRSEELLAARRTDGGKQFFSRAVDFGYSKNPDETFRMWDKDSVLGDVVRIIRKFKPDIIINRFDHRTPGTTHGHHTASAIASFEAFNLVSDKEYLPEIEAWEPTRLILNTSAWFYGGQEKFDNIDKSHLMKIDVGQYYPLNGMSNTEISALSRSFHRCQGFGTRGSRGEKIEYFEHLKGKPTKDKGNLFDGINTTWTRINGGEAIGHILNKIEDDFNFKDPSVHIPKLLEAYKLIKKIEDDYWRELKLNQIKKVIKYCLGLYLKAASSSQGSAPSAVISLDIEVTNRSNQQITLESLGIQKEGLKDIGEALEYNKSYITKIPVKIPNDSEYTTPYWLLKKHGVGRYNISNSEYIGMPFTPKTKFIFVIKIDDILIDFKEQIAYIYIDSSKGECSYPFVIKPKVTVNFSEDVYAFTNQDSKKVLLKIKSGKDFLEGTISLKIPDGWTVYPKEVSFNILKKNEEVTVRFQLTPSRKSTRKEIRPVLEVDGETYSFSEKIVDYNHINRQVVITPATAKVIKLNIKKGTTFNVGYIDGVGDKVPESLQQVGYNVTRIKPNDITNVNVQKYDAIVMGIRAYNVLKDFDTKQEILLKYVHNGGVLVVQYNTTNWLSKIEIKKFSPYFLNLSRDRVTEEDSSVSFLTKRHPVLNIPNNINSNDFDNWVQERGLYFPNEWDDKFIPILSMHDSKETSKDGSLLIAEYGKGHYVYTGISFFRQLPAGVLGAYKLFANILSLKAKDN